MQVSLGARWPSRSSRARYTTSRARAASAWTNRVPAWERWPEAVRKSLVALAVSCSALLALAASSLCLPRTARAGGDTATTSGDPTVAASALFALAEAEDARGDYASAAQHYRGAVDRLPSFRYAAKATTRAALLEAHAEGSWAPYARLEAVRRDPKAASDPAAIDALSAAADTFPPGPTRGEARMLCGEAYVARLHRRADGEASLRKVLDDPLADGLLRRQAASELVGALIDDGDLAGARATVLALGPTIDTKLGQRVAALSRRRRLHVASMGDLVVFGLLAASAVARRAARGGLVEVARALKSTLPLGVVFVAYVALGGGFLASAYETGNAEPFVAFGAVLLPITIAARAWGVAGSSGSAARLGRALLSATAVAAAALLTLEAVNGQYLEGFHL